MVTRLSFLTLCNNGMQFKVYCFYNMLIYIFKIYNTSTIFIKLFVYDNNLFI